MAAAVELWGEEDLKEYDKHNYTKWELPYALKKARNPLERGTNLQEYRYRQRGKAGGGKSKGKRNISPGRSKYSGGHPNRAYYESDTESNQSGEDAYYGEDGDEDLTEDMIHWANEILDRANECGYFEEEADEQDIPYEEEEAEGQAQESYYENEEAYFGKGQGKGGKGGKRKSFPQARKALNDARSSRGFYPVKGGGWSMQGSFKGQFRPPQGGESASSGGYRCTKCGEGHPTSKCEGNMRQPAAARGKGSRTRLTGFVTEDAYMVCGSCLPDDGIVIGEEKLREDCHGEECDQKVRIRCTCGHGFCAGGFAKRQENFADGECMNGKIKKACRLHGERWVFPDHETCDAPDCQDRHALVVALDGAEEGMAYTILESEKQEVKRRWGKTRTTAAVKEAMPTARDTNQLPTPSLLLSVTDPQKELSPEKTRLTFSERQDISPTKYSYRGKYKCETCREEHEGFAFAAAFLGLEKKMCYATCPDCRPTMAEQMAHTWMHDHHEDHFDKHGLPKHQGPLEVEFFKKLVTAKKNLEARAG